MEVWSLAKRMMVMMMLFSSCASIELNIAWYSLPPYIQQDPITGDYTGFFYTLIDELVELCFEAGDTYTMTQPYDNAIDMEENLVSQMISLPLIKRPAMLSLYSFITNVEFIPVFHSEGKKALNFIPEWVLP